ncbi:MAG TPA: Hsp33 family molecular chaperone HslO [Aquirhabdus sp.]
MTKETTTINTNADDTRQRFFIDNSPVRGDVVHISAALKTILKQREYPNAIKLMLGEMLAAAALLATTLKFKGRLSLQAQGSGSLKWVMAECTDQGELRGLAELEEGVDFNDLETSADALDALTDAVLFINIEHQHGERYQGIIPLEEPTIAGCLSQYYLLSAQVPTQICLACDGEHAAGLLVQLLPRNNEAEQELTDTDLWPRLTILTQTLKSKELIELPAQDILHRLYHEEDVRLPNAEPLKFGCTCSRERCIDALKQVGKDAVTEILSTEDEIQMDCQFCNTPYRFSPVQAIELFGLKVS